MSSSKTVISVEDIARIREECDALIRQVAGREAEKLQENSIRDRIKGERDAAVDQVIQLESQIQGLQEEIQQLTSDHRLQLEKVCFTNEQEKSQLTEQLSLLTQERDRLRREVEVFQFQDKSVCETIRRLEQEVTQTTGLADQLQHQVDHMKETIAKSAKMMNAAKQILNEHKKTIADDQKVRQDLMNQVADLKQQFVQFTAGKVQSTDGSVQEENEHLKIQLKQVEKEKQFHQIANQLTQVQKSEYEKLTGMFNQLKMVMSNVTKSPTSPLDAGSDRFHWK